MKSVSSRSMIRCLRTTRSARLRPFAVSSASLRSPRSIRPSPSSRFNISPADARATGVLIFLFWDVLSHAVGPVETALKEGRGGRFAWLAFLLTAGFFAGLMSLVYYDTWMKRRRRRAFLGPGAASTAEFEHDHHFTGMSPARWLAVFIATGIGLHNFSEGLAIGQSAAADKVSLAIVLIIGFGLHNATEGLGICAPLTGDQERPSWSFLALRGPICGRPTFPGTRKSPARGN